MRYVLVQNGERRAELLAGETSIFVRVVGFDPEPVEPAHLPALLAHWEATATEPGWELQEEPS